MKQDEIIVQIESTPAGLLGLTNEGNVFMYQNGKWIKF